MLWWFKWGVRFAVVGSRRVTAAVVGEMESKNCSDGSDGE
jgi:hypothetical protein